MLLLPGSARSPAWLKALLLGYDGALSVAEAVTAQRPTSVISRYNPVGARIITKTVDI